MSANRQNVEISAGDACTLTFTARDRTNTVINVTGAVIRWRMGTRGTDGIIRKDGEVVNGPAGTFSITLSAGDTLYLRERDYEHSAVVQANGQITTAVRGRFRVNQIVHPGIS